MSAWGGMGAKPPPATSFTSNPSFKISPGRFTGQLYALNNRQQKKLTAVVDEAHCSQ